MKFTKHKEEQPLIDITALIDVVFILLIFFMVTTTFHKEAELAINLPQAEQEPTSESVVQMEIVINAQGQYFVNGNELVNNHKETLKKAIKQVSQGKKDKPLIIRADARTPHQFVVAAMDIASQLGLVRLSIATTKPD